MKQKIIIKNFGPIKDVEMEIDDFTIFIGPQTSGKSTIAKSVFFFLSIREEFLNYLRDSFNKNNFDKSIGTFSKIIRQRFLDYWGTTYHLKDINLQYFYSENIKIGIKLEPNNKYVDIIFDFEDKLFQLINSTKLYSEVFHQKKQQGFLTSENLYTLNSDKDLFFDTIKQSVHDIFNFDSDLLFIPAGRSLLAILSEQIQEINPKKIDYLMKLFVDRINNSKQFFSKSIKDLVKEQRLLTQKPIDKRMVDKAEILIDKILKGSYRYDTSGEKIYLSKDSYIKLSFSSSGQQESIWILLLIFLYILQKQKVFIVIEEPEAHLFPETQREILNLIVLLANSYENKCIITTHSPYTLTCLNNNIYAYQVGQQNEEKVDKIIDKKLWMNPEKVQAYFVGGNDNRGKIRSIIHPELQIIQTEEIDSASSINNEEYDLLFDLD